MVRVYPKALQDKSAELKKDYDNLSVPEFRRKHPKLANKVYGKKRYIAMPRAIRRKLIPGKYSLESYLGHNRGSAIVSRDEKRNISTKASDVRCYNL